MAELQVLKDQRDLKDLKETLDHKDLKESRDHKVRPVLMVRTEQVSPFLGASIM
jgi:hypothetical protein